jgi:hypothetical protein
VPFLFFLLLVLLIATVGFWKALAAVLGAIFLMVVVGVLGVAFLLVGAIWAMTRWRGPSYRERE